MFTEVYDTSCSELMNARIRQAITCLRGLQFATREEYQAEVYSLLNGIVNLGDNMTPLATIQREGPAKIGDIENNLIILNNDAQAIVAEILDAENQAASIYNLFASTQNSLRQQIRELVYGATPDAYTGAFLGPDGLDTAASTATLDFNAADASSTLVTETVVAPASVSTGPGSSGSLAAGSSLANLTNGLEQTFMQWNAPVIPGGVPFAAVELVFSFTGTPVINRITLSLDTYR